MALSAEPAGTLEPAAAASGWAEPEVVRGVWDLRGVTERQFMEDLRLTSLRMTDLHIVRTFGEACHYRGPQSFADRHGGHGARLNFEPADEALTRGGAAAGAAEGRRPSSGADDDALLPLCCCDACGRWRRVDAETRRLFANDRWSQEALRDREADALRGCPALESLCAAFLVARPGRGARAAQRRAAADGEGVDEGRGGSPTTMPAEEAEQEGEGGAPREGARGGA